MAPREFKKLAPVAAVIALAFVAAVAVVLHLGSAASSLLAPAPISVNGIKYVPERLYAAAPGHVPPGAVIVNPRQFMGLATQKVAPHPAAAHLVKARAHAVMHQVKHVAHPHPASHKLPVATAVPIMEQARRSGNYGHLAENILTSMKGPVPVNRKGNVLRGAAPPVSRLASLPVYKKRVMSQDAKDLKDALLDCKRDSDDDCQKMLHLHDKSLAAFERDQDQADSGLFRIFEAAQHIHDARGARPNLARVGMLHELGGSLFPSKSNTDSYGIPNGGSLPGDNV